MRSDEHTEIVLQALIDRRSLRRYGTLPVPSELVQTVLEAARWAPSAHNRQPWRFVVIQSQLQKERLALAMGAQLRRDLVADGMMTAAQIAEDADRSYDRMTSAPVIILLCLTMADMDVYPDEKRTHAEMLMAVQSVAMAGQNLLLAAHAVGLGACWMCAPLFCPDVVQAALKMPNDWLPQALITLGYPAQTREKTRHTLEGRVLWR